jgi:hypothetical protein
MFYHLFVHGARPSIKFLILFYWTSLTISNYLHFTSSGSKTTYQIDLPSFVSYEKFLLPSLYCEEYHKGFTLGPLMFSIFINNFPANINYTKFLLLADDLSRHVEECKALQAHIDSIHQWCGENCVELNIQKTKISFTCDTNSIHFNYCVCHVLILHSDCIKDLGVMLDSKLYFHFHVDSEYSQALRTLGLVCFITYNLFPLDSLVVLCISLVRSKLEYACVVWNNLTSTDSNKIENIQIKLANLCYYHFFQFDTLCNYDLILSHLNSRTLYSRLHLGALHLINVFKGK